MDKLLNIVGKESFSVKIDEMELRNFISRVPIWDYAVISKIEYQNLSKEDQNSLLIKCYNAMLVESEGEIEGLVHYFRQKVVEVCSKCSGKG